VNPTCGAPRPGVVLGRPVAVALGVAVTLGRAVCVVVVLALGPGVGEDGVAVGDPVGCGVAIWESIGTTWFAEGAETRAPGAESIPTKSLDDGALTRAFAAGLTTDG